MQTPTHEGEHCPTQGGYPRCLVDRLSTSDCYASNQGHYQLRVNLGTGHVLAANNQVRASGWMPRAGLTCYFQYGTTQTYGPWTPGAVQNGPGALYNVPNCAGAFGFLLTGGGYCGG